MELAYYRSVNAGPPQTGLTITRPLLFNHITQQNSYPRLPHPPTTGIAAIIRHSPVCPELGAVLQLVGCARCACVTDCCGALSAISCASFPARSRLSVMRVLRRTRSVTSPERVFDPPAVCAGIGRMCIEPVHTVPPAQCRVMGMSVYSGGLPPRRLGISCTVCTCIFRRCTRGLAG